MAAPDFTGAVLAGQLYRDLLMQQRGDDYFLRFDYDDLARMAWEQAAAFLRVAKRHDLATGLPDGLPVDDGAEVEVAASSRR